MKKYLWMLLAVCSLCACSSDDTPQPEPKASATTTALVYLVADNNLDSYLATNVAAMYDGLSDLDVAASVLIYWDGRTSIGGSSSPAILRYTTDGYGNINGYPCLDETATLDDVLALAEVVKEYPSQLSTDKAVMSQVLKDMVKLVTTEKMGLIAGSHGSAWINSIYGHSRSFGQDGSGTDNTILIPDMAEAMASTGRTFDFLLFDACMMSTAEVCYEFKDVTNYQIVSVVDIPAAGFPYESMLKYLCGGTLADYKQVCQTYISYYREESLTNSSLWGAISLVDSKEMDNLTAAIKEQIVSHKEDLADYDTNGLQHYGLNTSATGFKYISFDVEQFVRELNGGVVPTPFQAQLYKTVVYTDFIEDTYYFNIDGDNYCGLGMYIPVESRPKWNEYFKTLDWYTVAGWNQVDFSWEF